MAKYFIFQVALLTGLVSLTVQANSADWESVGLLSSDWRQLQYSGVPANQVEFLDKGFVIRVDCSASPLIFPLKKSRVIREVMIEAQIEGSLKLGSELQGGKGADDFLLRVGLVYEGERRLNFLEKLWTPDWIAKLLNYVNGRGLGSIEFYNVYSDVRLKGKARTHPESDLIKENFWKLNDSPKGTQPYSLNAAISFPEEKKVMAFWLGSDGDDTQSRYDVKIHSLKVR